MSWMENSIIWQNLSKSTELAYQISERFKKWFLVGVTEEGTTHVDIRFQLSE